MDCPSCETLLETASTLICCPNCGFVIEEGSLLFLNTDSADNRSRSNVYFNNHSTKSINLKRRHIRTEKLLKSCAITLNLQGLEEKANNLYEKVSKTTPRLNNKGDLLTYTCLYIAARQANMPITFKSFASFDTKIDHYKLGRLYKKVISRLGIAPEQTFSENLILRLYSSLLEGLKIDEDVGSLKITGDISRLNSVEMVKTTEEIIRLSKIAMLNSGREEAGLVAASIVIAFQYHLNVFLSIDLAKKLLSYQVSGSAAFARYKEIKEFLKVSLSLLLGDCDIIQERFYRYIPALKDLDESSLEVVSTNKTLKRCAKEAVSQNMYTILASQKLKGLLDPNKYKLYCSQPEILLREEALKNNISFETVCKLSSRDIYLQLNDKVKRVEISNNIELSDRDLSEKEFQSIYVSGSKKTQVEDN